MRWISWFKIKSLWIQLNSVHVIVIQTDSWNQVLCMALLKFHSSHMTISVIQLESANTMYFEVTVRWVIKSNPSSLALLTLNFVCCLILGHWWVSESFHQSPPRVASPPADIILPLQPSSQHVVEEGWWVLHDIQSGNRTESQHQSQSKDLILLQVH